MNCMSEGDLSSYMAAFYCDERPPPAFAPVKGKRRLEASKQRKQAKKGRKYRFQSETQPSKVRARGKGTRPISKKGAFAQDEKGPKGSAGRRQTGSFVQYIDAQKRKKPRRKDSELLINFLILPHFIVQQDPPRQRPAKKRIRVDGVKEIEASSNPSGNAAPDMLR
jgi:hypothetical protein